MSSADDMQDSVHPSDSPTDQEDNCSTGLSWPDTWRGVYLLVLGSFVLWVGLLFALSVTFR